MDNKMPRVSEFTSYTWIKGELSRFGWVDRNPSRNPNGQVYAQQECLDNVSIREQLVNDRPEFVVKIAEDKFYVIEAKAMLNQLQDAVDEAVEYAQKINRSSVISAPIISGIAGNDDDGYVVRSFYFDGERFQPISYNDKELTSIITPELAKELIELNSGQLAKLEVNEEQLLVAAEEINEVLHAGSINKDERAAVMANLLLATIDDTEPNYNASPTVFIDDLNSRAQHVLVEHNKNEFFDHIKMRLPSRPDAQAKYKKSLVTTLFLLKKINIKAAMNSGTDILGKFYEVFLKYGNGAKDIGIVLTPRHITKFATEALNITARDLVYDPTCGTGGFLVSAFDHVRAISTEEETNVFKQYNVFGIEQQPKVAAMAIVNMIFRGDGKNNIIDNDCLSQSIVRSTIDGQITGKYISGQRCEGQLPAITRVLMNPPFALKDNDEKEYKFVQHALDQMADGGLMFAILPISVMLAGGVTKTWRKERLLRENTLLSVVHFPDDLFYPVGVQTLGIFVKKGIPHPENQNVMWIRGVHDGYRKKKGKRLLDAREPNPYPEISEQLALFIQNPRRSVISQPRYMKTTPIDMQDTTVELVPEAYLDDLAIDEALIADEMETLLRSAASYLIESRKI